MSGIAEPELVLYGIIAIIVVENLFETYLSFRQVNVYRTALKVPKELEGFMSEDTFHKARLYGLDKEQFHIYKTLLIDVFMVSLEIYFGLIAYFWTKSANLTEYLGWNAQNEIIVSCVYLTIVAVLTFFKDLPVKLYKTFVLEEKHGFNKQTLGFFAWDQVKGFLVSQLLMTPISAAIIYIVQIGGKLFPLYLFLFSSIMSLLLLTLYPIFIAPLFDTYTPLKDGELRTSIERLAASLKFPLTKLYVVDGSKRSAHSNAYFYGLWNSKRIVLYDTLLLNKGEEDDSKLDEDEKGKGCSNEEVLAVLAHELGHWQHSHIVANIVLAQMHLLLLFVVFYLVYNYRGFYEAVGFEPGTQPILVGLMIVLTYVMAPFNAAISFYFTKLSRRFEYQADEFARARGFKSELGNALIKLNLDNLGFPVHDWLYSAWNHSHPTLLQRLKRLEENEAAQAGAKKLN